MKTSNFLCFSGEKGLVEGDRRTGGPDPVAMNIRQGAAVGETWGHGGLKMIEHFLVACASVQLVGEQ